MEAFDSLKRALASVARLNKDAYFLYADGYGNLIFDDLKKEFPERVISFGISEQNGISMSAGLALSGKLVYVMASATFLSTRAFEQIRDDCAYNNANVKIIAWGSGFISNRDAGYAHCAIEDIALMRCLPHMTIVAPETLKDVVEYFIKYASENHGPMYIRLDDPVLSYTITYEDFEFGKLAKVMNGKDFAIITTGNMVKKSIELAESCNEYGNYPLILYAHTLKPFDKSKVISLINAGMPIVTIEDHGIGGLSSIVAEIIAQHGKAVKFLPIFIKDNSFNFVCRSEKFACKRLLDWDNVVDKINRLIRYKFKFISKKIFLKTKEKKKVKYYLFGIIPIFKIVERRIEKENKFANKYYLFSFLRLV